MEEGPYYEEFCGSIYLRKGNSKDILRMVDGTDEIALAFERENYSLVRHGSVTFVSEYMSSFNAIFPGYVGYIALPRGVPLEDINEILRTRNVRAFLTKHLPTYPEFPPLEETCEPSND